MSTDLKIILFDGESRRRAAISHCLAASGIHVEPFETTDELIARWPDAGMILVHDDHERIAALTRHMANTGGWLPTIAFAEAPTPAMIVAAVIEGAISYVAWPFDSAELTEALALARSRAASITSGKVREAAARSRIARLTRREREVLGGIASGLSNRVIGEQLAISPRTVEIHRANMLDKIGAAHTSDAIRLAVEASLVS